MVIGGLVASLACLVAVRAADVVTAGREEGAEAKPARGGRLSVDQAVLDIGDVVRGETATATFVLRNTGEETLKILSARPG